MRYAVISDVHGNLEALEAVLEALQKERVGAYLSLGDMVGYGADPIEVIKAVRSLNPKVSIAGNHDWGAIGKVDVNDFNKFAQEAIDWTAKVLTSDDKEYLRSLKLKDVEAGITLVHGSLEDPESFNYILNEGDAYLTMELLNTQICFVGHSHSVAAYCEKSKKVKKLDSTVIKLEKGTNYLINAGSVGQPRDFDPRASYVIYDDETMVIEFKRVAYDVQKAQKKILDAGLPPFLAYRLQDGQ